MGVPLFLAGCASVNVGSEQPVVIKASRFEISESVTTERHANAVEMLYFNSDNALTLRRPDGTEQILSENKGGDMRLAYATLHSDGKALFAIWRPKLVKPIEGVGVNGDKLIYVRTSLDDGKTCLLYTSDAADERSSVDLGGRRIIKKKTRQRESRGQ